VLIIRQCREHGLPAPQWRSDEKLGVTLTFLAPHVTPHVTPHVPLQVAPHVTRLVRALAGEMSRSELMVAMGIKDRAHFGSAYLRPALAAAMVEMTQPDKPKSSKQRYRLTLLGQAVAADVIANDRQDKLHTD
jgi:ATP-dependent DNA helicase RecG